MPNNITDSFYCAKLDCRGLSFRTCILRQIEREKVFGNTVRKNLECRDCPDGKAIKQEFKDIEVKFGDKRTKPHRYLIGQVSKRKRLSGVDEKECQAQGKKVTHAEGVNSPQGLETPMQERFPSAPERKLSRSEVRIADRLDKAGKTEKILAELSR